MQNCCAAARGPKPNGQSRDCHRIARPISRGRLLNGAHVKLDTLERFLAGLAVLMSAAALGAAYLFEFQSYYSAFDRLQRSIGFVLGPWVVAAAVTGLIWLGGNLLKFRVPVLEVFFTLICGASAVSILEALR